MPRMREFLSTPQDYATRRGRKRLYSYLGWLTRGRKRLAAKMRYMDGLHKTISQRLQETSPRRNGRPRDPKTGKWAKA